MTGGSGPAACYLQPMGTAPSRPPARSALAESPVFHQLGDDLHDKLFERIAEQEFDAGDVLIRQGDPGEFLMLVLEGHAAVRLREEGGMREIATFGAGDVVGEMALLTGESRTADVVAVSKLRALVLQSQDFHQLAMHHPELGMVLTHLVADRLGEGALDGLLGKHVGRYQIGRCLGRGGMAVVYEARELDGGHPVALKMMSHRLLYEPGANARFKREAEILLELRHPNIARVFHQFSSFRTSFMALELCEGPNLGDILDRHGALEEPQARAVIGQIAAALCHLHELGVVHRDLKPVNVMSTLEGTLKITDFGLAKNTAVTTTQDALTDSRTILGLSLIHI